MTRLKSATRSSSTAEPKHLCNFFFRPFYCPRNSIKTKNVLRLKLTWDSQPLPQPDIISSRPVMHKQMVMEQKVRFVEKGRTRGANHNVVLVTPCPPTYLPNNDQKPLGQTNKIKDFFCV
jgi:hypothetical protein